MALHCHRALLRAGYTPGRVELPLSKDFVAVYVRFFIFCLPFFFKGNDKCWKTNSIKHIQHENTTNMSKWPHKNNAQCLCHTTEIQI